MKHRFRTLPVVVAFGVVPAVGHRAGRRGSAQTSAANGTWLGTGRSWMTAWEEPSYAEWLVPGFTEEQQFGYQGDELVTGQRGKATLGWSHAPNIERLML